MLASFAVKRFSNWFGWFGFFGISLLVAGCAAMPSPTGGAAGAGAPGQFGAGSLTALQVAVQRLRDGTSDTSLGLGDRVDVLPKDRIAIDDKGRGLLKFQDNLAVELFRGAKMEIAGTYLAPAGFTLVRLKQTVGHSRIELMKQASARVELETDYATITALTDNTEIMAWHEPGSVTCIVATRGGAEVEALGQKVDLKAGQTTHVLPGQAPLPATCAHLDEMGPWLDKLRGVGPVRDLDKLVTSWAGKPCPPP